MMLTTMRPVGHIKAQPEDFVVMEEQNGRIVSPIFETIIRRAESAFTAFTLTKRNTQAVDAYREVARQLGITRSQITDCGRKDKVALTTQTIVVEGDYVPVFSHSDMWLQYQGPAVGPLWHGAHAGNRFRILVRTDAPNPPDCREFRNLFGPQRFWGNLEIGKFLLEGDFDQAMTLLESSASWYKLKRIMRDYLPLYRRAEFDAVDSWSAIKVLTKGLFSAEAILEDPDFREQLAFEILKWQSHLWNLLARRTRTNEERLPMWGRESAALYADLWCPKANDIDGAIEVDQAMLDLSHQFSRRLKVTAKSHQIIECDEGFWHEFILPPGAYATVFLDTMYTLVDDSRESYPVMVK